MDEWRKMPIGELCLGIYDGPHATPEKTDSGPIFLGISNLVDGRIDLSSTDHLSEEDFVKWTRRVTPQPGDVVFSYETRLGEAALIPEGLRCCLGRRMALMRPNPELLDSRFLLYAYLGPQFQSVLTSRTVYGSTVNRIPLIEFPDFLIRISSLATQKAIAHILGTLDDKIELNRRMNRTLEQIAKAIFKSWFIDFDPVRAKAEGRQPEGMDAEVAALFPSEFEDSELGEIPRGWKASKLGDIAIEKRDSVNPDEISASTAYVGLEHMPKQSISLDTWGKAEAVSSNKLLFSEGDFLFGKLRPYFHKVGVAPLDGICSTDIVVLNAARPHWYGYVLGIISSKAFVDYTSMASTGTKMPRTNWKDMSRYDVIVPDEAVSGFFNDLVKNFIKQLQTNIFESIALAANRDLLLPRLISGDLPIADAESFIEDIT